MKKIILILCIAVFLISIVSAAKPLTSIPLSQGLQISYISPYYIQQNTNLSIRFWVYNLTDGGLLTNKTVNCTYNLLNDTGRNVLKFESPASSGIAFGNLGPGACTNCYNLEISAKNFSSIGYYSWQIRCQGINIGGYINGDYLVLTNKYSQEILMTSNTDQPVYVLMFVCLIFLLLYMNTTDKYFKYFWFAVFFLFLVITISMASIIIYNDNTFDQVKNIYDTLTAVAFYSLWLVFGLLFFFLVWKLYLEYMGMAALKEAERFGTEMDFTKFNKGFS